MKITTMKGFRDILPEEAEIWRRVASAAREVFEAYGFREIVPPIMEKTELFSRSIGEETDIVSKEMYTLKDSKGRGMTLRPEATASVARAYIQNRLDQETAPQKLYCMGPMFRHERPQKGRFRQFHQVNAELFGDPGPRSDAEIIAMVTDLFDTLGLRDLELRLNSLGCPHCRPGFRDELVDYLSERMEALCADCRRRAQANPLRVFDCKVAACGEAVASAPSMLDFICPDCADHFQGVKQYLDSVDISYVVDRRLVRGLDYYTRTAFEIQTGRLGSQNAVAGGGRYDGLLALLGGPDVPAIGFAVGMERVVALLEENFEYRPRTPDLFIAALGEDAERKAFAWASGLRKSGLWVEMGYGSRGLKSQMKRAGRLGADKVLIVGDAEIASGKGTLRDMNTKSQGEIALDGLPERLEGILRPDRLMRGGDS